MCAFPIEVHSTDRSRIETVGATIEGRGMLARNDREQALLAKLRDLADERVAEVEDFVDFLRARDMRVDQELDPTYALRARDEHRQLVEAAGRLSEPALAAVWDNPEDDVYNDL
jgi:hypothetical protein